MIENYLNGTIWKYFMKNKYAIKGLEILEFTYTKDNKLKINKVMTSSVITKVKRSKIEKIKNILRDNTMYNLTCTQQCLAISYLDMLVLVKLNKQ